MGAFEDIVAQATPEDRIILAKYPGLKKSSDEVDEYKAKFSDADGRLRQWEDWKAREWDSTARMTKQQKLALERAEQLQTDLATLQASAGAEMTFEEILAGLQGKGFITKAELDQTLKNQIKDSWTPGTPEGKLVTDKAVAEVTGAMSLGFEHVFTKTFNLGRRHEKEFGEELEIGTVLKYMNENRVNDPEIAYNQMMAGRRSEAEKKRREEVETKHKEELEVQTKKAREEGEKEGVKKAAMSQGGRIPTDQGTSPGSVGHLQRLQQERQKISTKPPEGADVPAGVKLGQGTLAELGYEELVKAREAGA